MRILLVEDDALVGDAIQYRLRREHYTVDWVRDGGSAACAAKTGQFQLMVLDLGLPVLDGMGVLAGMRLDGDTTPVLALTAQDALEDRVAGLDAGADDYLVKPFEMVELLARCRALLRRSKGHADNVVSIEGMILDLKAHSLEVDGQAVILPPYEYRILAFLVRRHGRVVSKPQIEEMLYGWSKGSESNTVEVHISQLRRKIGPSRIKTLRGIGYMVP